MILHQRNGNIYGYQSVRQGGRVTTRYLGSGVVAQSARDVQEFVSERREDIKTSHELAQQTLKSLDAPWRQLEAATWSLYSGSLYDGGYHLNRRNWRRRSER